MSTKINYKNEPLDRLQVMPNFLPSPEELALREEGVKGTMALSKKASIFFKSGATENQTQYPRMFRRLIDAHVDAQASRNRTSAHDTKRRTAWFFAQNSAHKRGQMKPARATLARLLTAIFVHIIFIAALVFSTQSHAAYKRMLKTSSYVITISVLCDEGEVVCDRVDYLAINRKNGRSIKLHGRDITSNCLVDLGDGPVKTPCSHLGYEFKSDSFSYQVWNDGTLEVWRQSVSKVKSPNQLLLTEKGAWSHIQVRLNKSLKP